MARIRLVKGSTAPTKRNFKTLLPIYLTYANSVGIVILALKLLNVI